MQISSLFWAHPVDTEQWHCQEHFQAHIDVWRDCISVKQTGKRYKNSSLVNKVDLGAVPQVQFCLQEILNQLTPVGTCIVTNKAQASYIGCMFAFLSGF